MDVYSTLNAHLEARLRELLLAVAGAFAEAQHQRHGRVQVLPEAVGHCPAAEWPSNNLYMTHMHSRHCPLRACTHVPRELKTSTDDWQQPVIDHLLERMNLGKHPLGTCCGPMPTAACQCTTWPQATQSRLRSSPDAAQELDVDDGGVGLDDRRLQLPQHGVR